MNKIISKIYLFLTFIFLYLPVVFLVIFSFNKSKSRVVFSGFTLKWYKELFKNQEILGALYNTLIIALISTFFATIIGTFAAVIIPKLNKFLEKIILNITNLPMINPEIVSGVSLMLLFVFFYKKTGLLSPGIFTLILAHSTFCLPYVILSVLPKVRQINPKIYEAAQDLGCPPILAFFKVILPDISPGILTGAIMSFTLSVDDFVISYFTGGATQTLPIAIYSMTKKGISPQINALSTILFSLVFILLIFTNIRNFKERQC